MRDPETVDKTFNNIPFDATMAKDDPSAEIFITNPGWDGFSVDTQPILEVSVS